jgi:hypothetical protein
MTTPSKSAWKREDSDAGCQTQQPTRVAAERERPPTTAELDAMTDEQLQAMVARKPEPLPDDWMFRSKLG